jgi:DNA polymerase-3 subunit epsilon
LIFDTLPMARKIFPGLANYRLGNLVQHLKLSSDSEFHRAEEDATYCGKVFCSILQKLGASGQNPRIENLIALSGGKELRFPIIERQPKQLSLI